MDWIIKQCDARSMNVTTVEEPNLNFGNQIWLEIKKKLKFSKNMPRNRFKLKALTRIRQEN